MLRFRLLCALGTAVAATAAIAPVTAQPVSAVPAAAPTAPVKKPACGNERPLKQDGGRYTCTFEDDFDGSAVDTRKWVVQDTALSGVIAPSMGCYVNKPNNVRVGGGVLMLTARKESSAFLCRSPYGAYLTDRTSATIGSYGLFNQTYGRFEFRAKMPATTTTGVHSALWLYPQDHTYGAWPNSGEIDVAEWFSADAGRVYPSVHYAGENSLESTGYECRMPDTSQFHRYAVEWTPTTMRFLYDGNVCFTHSWTPNAPLTAPQPFDRPFYVVLTQVFGGAWNAITAQTPTSATMTVDWVRVWQ